MNAQGVSALAERSRSHWGGEGLPRLGLLPIDFDGAEVDEAAGSGGGGLAGEVECACGVGAAECFQWVGGGVVHDVDTGGEVDDDICAGEGGGVVGGGEEVAEFGAGDRANGMVLAEGGE